VIRVFTMNDGGMVFHNSLRLVMLVKSDRHVVLVDRVPMCRRRVVKTMVQ
jgi:hypothetical protein